MSTAKQTSPLSIRSRQVCSQQVWNEASTMPSQSWWRRLKILTTDRFFNGLLQQHHFGPREFDFAGSEALEGMNLPTSSLRRSLRLLCGQRLFADRIAPLGMEEFLVDEKFGLVEGLTTNILPFRQNPVRTFPLQTQSYPETRSIQCAEGYSAVSSTSAESLSFVVYCAKNGSLFSLQALSARSA